GLEEERRLFYVGVTRAMRELYLTHARRRAVFGAQAYGVRSRFLEEIPAELMQESEEPRAAWTGRPVASPLADGPGSGTGAWAPPDGALVSWSASSGSGSAPAPAFRLGEDVVHAGFGEGVVTGVEPDGVIVVRFAGDGSERKLMAEYAPVSRR